MSLTARLNCRVELYGKVETENEYGQKNYEYVSLKKVWAEVLPGAGTLKDGQGNTKYANISHKFIIRKSKKIVLTNDMYFIFEGQRYDIRYYNPNYKNKDRVEIFCELVVE